MLTKATQLRIDESTEMRLSSIAKKKGIGITTLARMLILEKLDEIAPLPNANQSHQTTGTIS